MRSSGSLILADLHDLYQDVAQEMENAAGLEEEGARYPPPTTFTGSDIGRTLPFAYVT